MFTAETACLSDQQEFIPAIHEPGVYARADMFAGILLVVFHSSERFDAYSINLKQRDSGKIWVMRYSSQYRHWQLEHHHSFELADLAKAMQGNPCFPQYAWHMADSVIDFIQWLGLELTLENFLFFLTVPDWIRKDYPKVYVLLCWHVRKMVMPGMPLTRETIDLLVDRHVGKSELKNIRKIDVEGEVVDDVVCAAFAIIEEYELLKPYISHEANVSPTFIVKVVQIYRRCRYIQRLPWIVPLIKAGEFDCINDQIIPALNDIDAAFGLCLSELYANRFLKNEVKSLPKLLWLKQSLMEKEIKPMDLEFPENILRESQYFRKVKFTSELRAIAENFSNCAARYVVMALSGDCFFFLYGNEEKRERALLMLFGNEGSAQEFVIEQFYGPCNQPVSNAALVHLKEWAIDQIRINKSIKIVNDHFRHQGDAPGAQDAFNF